MQASKVVSGVPLLVLVPVVHNPTIRVGCSLLPPLHALERGHSPGWVQPIEQWRAGPGLRGGVMTSRLRIELGSSKHEYNLSSKETRSHSIVQLRRPRKQSE